MEGFDYVMDARDDATSKYTGPYDPGAGKVFADQMNDFLTPAFVKRMGGKQTGPFYVVPWRLIPANHQKELRRLYECS